MFGIFYFSQQRNSQADMKKISDGCDFASENPKSIFFGNQNLINFMKNSTFHIKFNKLARNGQN